MRPGENPITTEAATVAAETLAALIPYFPSTSEVAVTALAAEIFKMCPSVEAAQFITRRALALWRKWEGLPELRAILCSKYKPRDGIEGDSALFIDGIPSETPPNGPRLLPPAPESATPAQIEARRKTAVAGLPDGATASADAEAENLVRRAVRRVTPPEIVRERLAAIQRKPLTRKERELSREETARAAQELREILAEQKRNQRAAEKAEAEPDAPAE